jgi:ribosomal protein L37AE/L43A
MRVDQIAVLLVLGPIITAVVSLLVGAASYLAYYTPKCPFCGGRMTRSRLNTARAYCHKCGAMKDGGHFVKEG